MEDLLEIEMWPEYNSAQHRADDLKQPIPWLDFFACFVCRKLRCASKVSNAIMKSKRGKLGSGTSTDKIWRVCLLCGIKFKTYKGGD